MWDLWHTSWQWDVSFQGISDESFIYNSTDVLRSGDGNGLVLWLEFRKELVLAQHDVIRKVNLKFNIYEIYPASA
jgi:hypothetical protein